MAAHVIRLGLSPTIKKLEISRFWGAVKSALEIEEHKSPEFLDFGQIVGRNVFSS